MAVQSPLLKETRGGLNVFYNNKYLYSEYNPVAGAIKAAHASFQSGSRLPGTLYIIPSPLLWYGAEIIRKKYPEETVIAVEADTELHEIAARYGQGIKLYRTSDLKAEALYNLKGWPFRRVEFIPLNGAFREQQQEYAQLHTYVTGIIQQYWQNRLTLQHLVPLWIRNIYKNLSGRNSYLPLSALKTQKPVVLAGAGESLESFPAEHVRDMFIVAIDTALPYFIQRGIRPDAVLAVDGQFFNFLDFIGLDTFADIPLIMDITLYPGINRLFSGRKYLFMTDFWASALTGRLSSMVPDRLKAFGSVGIAGMEIALNITENYVYYTGLDFCFDLGKTHARGTTYTDASSRTRTRLMPFPLAASQLERGISVIKEHAGSSAYSDKQLLSYASIVRQRRFSKTRIHKLPGPGIDLGFSTVMPEVISKAAAERPVNETGTAGIAIRSGNAFLRSEQTFLTYLYNAAYTLLSTGKGLEGFLHAYSECDYPGLHMPDMDPEKPHPIQLKRLLMAVKLYKRTIEDVLEDS